MPRHKAYDKQEVLEKAMQVFWDHGYEATSVRLLEKEMGINQFSIYSAFDNKKKLFVESLKKYRAYVKNNRFHPLLKEDARLKDLKEFLNNIPRQIKSGETKRGCLVVNTTGEIGGKDPEIAKELKNYYNFIKEMLRKVLWNSVEAGEISEEADLEKYSNYLLGVMQSLSVGTKVLTEKQINDIISMALINIK
ncbi:MAG: TetR/AcrR family transcriptional regulator [Bacteroidales bacterium]